MDNTRIKGKEQEMIELKTIEIAGLLAASQAVRLPHNKPARSEGFFDCKVAEGEYDEVNFTSQCSVGIIRDDLRLMEVLKKRGDEHAKVLRGIIVWASVKAPRYIWQEFDTYRIGADKLSSESTMHTIGNGNLTIENFSVSDIVKESLTPNVKEEETQKLYIEKPEVLESRIIEKYGREYEVWNDGRVFAMPFTTSDAMPDGSIRNRFHEKKQLKYGERQNPTGYFQIGLGGRKGRAYQLHRLLAECFIPNPNNYPVVNHKDGNKGNCSISNLEWCTSSYNNKHAFDTGLKTYGIRQKYLSFKNSKKYNEDDVIAWITMHESGMTYQKMHEETGIAISVLNQAILGKTQKRLSEYSEEFETALRYELVIDQINKLALLYNEDKDTYLLEEIKRLLPESFIQSRIINFSYQTLRRIYYQRYNHRLPEWRKFCGWIETLPFAKELILNGDEK